MKFSRIICVCSYVAASQVCFPSATHGTSYLWDGSSGAQFTNSNNWTPAGIPGAADATTFRLGAVPAYPVLLFQGLFEPVNVTVERVLVGTNTVSLAGGVLTVDSTVTTETGRGLVIGQTGSDAAAVVNSSLQGFSTVYGTLGASVGSSGTLNVNSNYFNVTGSGAIYELIVGHGGIGTINVSGGADVSVADSAVLGNLSTGTGNVSVSGSGSTWTSTNSLTIGGTGHGALNIATGGHVANYFGYIGKLPGSTGAVTVDGAATSWDSNFLYVGYEGSGTLDILAGADVLVGAAGVAHSFVGIRNGVSGEVTVDGMGSTWSTTGVLTMGYDNSTGGGGDATVTIQNNAVVTVGEDVHIGSTSQINVSGGGSLDSGGDLMIDGGSLTATTNAQVDFVAGTFESGTTVTVASGATLTHTGMLDLQSNATMQVHSGATYASYFTRVGTTPGPAAQLLIDAPGTRVTSPSCCIDVGYGGAGVMTVTDGARVETPTGAVGSFGPGSIGTLTLSGRAANGDRSSWITSVGLNMGLSATSEGTIFIQDGGLLDAASLSVGTPGKGTVFVDGVHSTGVPSLLDVGVLDIGGGPFGNGTGDVTVMNGGRIVGGSVNLAASGGAAALTITDADSALVQSGAATLTVGHAALGSATVHVLDGGVVTSGTGPIIVAETGAVTLDGSVAQGRFNANGPMTVRGAVAVGDLPTEAGGFLDVNAGLTIDGGTVQLRSGVVDANAITTMNGGALDFDGGTLHVDAFNGNLLNEGGTLAPGHSAGATAVSGNYTQRVGARLEVEISGVIAGQWDTLAIGGNAVLDGTLEIKLIDGFEPVLGNSFTILTTNVGNVGDVFAMEILPVVNGVTFDVVYNPKSVVLAVIEAPQLVGDYNLNGVVDAADYTVWRDTLGQMGTGLAADGDASGTIDAGDYDVWKMHFGETAGAGSAGASPSRFAVPEPATLCLMLAVLFAATLTRGVPRPGLP